MTLEVSTNVLVTVEAVTLSTGVRQRELAWSMVYPPTGGVPAITRKAALDWWHDTDQAGQCRLRFGLVFPGGGRHQATCEVGPSVEVKHVCPRVVKELRP